MVVEEVTNGSVSLIIDAIERVGKVGSFLQAVGVLAVIYIIFNVIETIVNRKIRRTVYRIEDRLKIVEGKIDKLLKKS